MSSKRVKYEISFELFHHLVMYIQIASLKLCILPTNIHNLKQARFKLQNSIYAFDWNIVAFQAFVMSCFDQ